MSVCVLQSCILIIICRNCSHYEQANLLHELILAVGYFCVLNHNNQACQMHLQRKRKRGVVSPVQILAIVSRSTCILTYICTCGIIYHWSNYGMDGCVLFRSTCSLAEAQLFYSNSVHCRLNTSAIQGMQMNSFLRVIEILFP